jgi:hypothetical protein
VALLVSVTIEHLPMTLEDHHVLRSERNPFPRLDLGSGQQRDTIRVGDDVRICIAVIEQEQVPGIVPVARNGLDVRHSRVPV